MCEFIFIVFFVSSFIISIIFNNLTNFLDKPKFRINAVYRTFVKNSLKNNITNEIDNEILFAKLLNNLNIMVDTISEDTYRDIFNNTDLYEDSIYPKINNLTYHLFQNKTGIDKLFFNEFYDYLFNLNKLYFENIYYYHITFKNESKYDDIYYLINDAWLNNNLDLEFIKVSNKLTNILKNNKIIKNANKDFTCYLILNSEKCPDKFILYDNFTKNRDNHLTRILNMNSHYTKKYKYYYDKNLIECCNY